MAEQEHDLVAEVLSLIREALDLAPDAPGAALLRDIEAEIVRRTAP